MSVLDRPASAPLTSERASPDPPPRTPHWTHLDGLRGIAILLVYCFHAHVPGPQGYIGGYIGVDLFFVLSGFLITTLLVQEWNRRSGIHLGHFLIRRALRLLPALVLMLTVFIAGEWFTSDEFSMRVRDVFVVLFYGANWARVWLDGFSLALGHTWSLSLEEQFYLVWPLLFVFVMRTRWSKRTVAGWLIVGALAAAGWRAWLFHQGAGMMRVYNGIDTRADALLLGCAAAFLAADLPVVPARWHRWIGRGAVGCAAVIAAFVLYSKSDDPPMIYAGYLSLAAVASGLILALHWRGAPRLRALLEWRPLTMLGKISYGAYLWHYIILFKLREYARLHSMTPGWGRIALLGAALTLLIAILSYRLMELPLQQLRRHFR